MRIRYALLRLAALAGLLNLASCITSEPKPAPVGLVAYSPKFQENAAQELAVIAAQGACYSPHVVALVVDYKGLRDEVRALNPALRGVRGASDETTKEETGHAIAAP
jgi:hypothetical protein